MTEEMQVYVVDRAVGYRFSVFKHIYDTHTLMDRDGTIKIHALLFSVKQIADALNISKSTASKILDGMVGDGALVRERYLLTKSEKDKRWRWLYHITNGGIREADEQGIR